MDSIRNMYRKTIKQYSPDFHKKLVAASNAVGITKILEVRDKKSIKNKLLQYLEIFPQQDVPDELLKIIEFLKTNQYCMMPYSFTSKYINRKVPVYYDSVLQMVYIVENDRKLYFKRGFTKDQALSLYNVMAYEQDDASPHRYLTSEIHMMGTLASEIKTSGFTINKGDAVADIGTAEGNFAFSIVDLVSKLYLFECDTEWIRALEETFKDYNNKVTIISKYVSDVNDESSVSLDVYFRNCNTVNFIKADIEGYEWQALLGMRELLKRSSDIRIAVCTYHKPNDSIQFENFLKKLNFKVDFTQGYMGFTQVPYLRKGVLRAISPPPPR